MGMLVCPLCCDNLFPNQLSLRNHLLGVVKNVHCPDCKERFETIHELAFHLDGICPIASMKNEEILKTNDQTEPKRIFVGEESTENIFHENETMHVDDELHNAENCGSIATHIKIEKDDENDEFSEVTCPENSLSDPLKFEICDEDRQISDTEFESIEQRESDTFSSHHSTDMEELQCNSQTSVGDDCEASGIFVQEIGHPGSSHRFSCSKCGVTFNSVREHIRKFHNGLNVNLNMPQKLRNCWKQEDMKAAIIAVRNKTLSIKKASRVFNVPTTTLLRKVRNKEEDIEKLITGKIGRKNTLSAHLETLLVSHCIEMKSRFYNLSYKDIKRMAFKLASMNCANHPFSKSNEAAGSEWLKNFLSRHPNLKAKKWTKPKFVPEKVKEFFNLYQPLIDSVQYMPSRLYNYDMAGVAVVNNSKIIYLRERNEIGLISEGDKCSLVTMITCMNAAGHFLPLLLIFPKINIKSEIISEDPDGPVVISNTSSWIEDEILVTWLQKFISIVKPAKDDPVILIMGCHQSYMWNIEFLELARENGVCLICLPPESVDKMQPLELGFMQSFKSHFGESFKTWKKQSKNKQSKDSVITYIDIGKMLYETFKKTATMKAAVDGFSKAGLFPYSPRVFNDNECLEVQDLNKNGDESIEISLFDTSSSDDDSSDIN